MALTTEEEMALAVLRGDHGAAAALADKLIEDRASGTQIPEVKRITCTDPDRIRVVVYYDESVLTGNNRPDIPNTLKAVDQWLHKGVPLLLVGVSRIELYELPPDYPIENE